MSRSFAICFCILQLGLLINATGLYTVIGPGTIRSNYKYNVAVSVHKADVKSVIKVGITGPSYNETKQVEVQPKSTVNVEFDVPKLSNGDYNLTAAGIEGVIFENSTRLNYADNKPSVFIQTDKATYKPGDLVQYRVLALDANTRPAVIDKPITIAINDGAQNRIKQLTDVKLTKGVFAGELQLSEQPMLGTWNIAVSIADDSSETKSFEVAKYVLPKFEVVVESVKNIAKQDGVLKATIRAKYTYGKPVKGKATVSIQPNYNYYSISDGQNQMKTIDVDGKGHVEFSLTPFDSSSYLPALKIFAEVTEDLTGNKQNASTLVTLHEKRYKLEAVDNSLSYHPGKSFDYQVVVKNLDGSPVQDATKKVKLIFEPFHRYFNFDRQSSTFSPSEPDNESHVFEAPLNEHGIATFNVTLPENIDRYFSVKASYADVTSSLGTINKFQPAVESNDPLKIEVNTKAPKLGNSISFDVKSNEHIPYFVYTIVARGNIVKSEYVEVPEDRKSHTIKFTPTFEMVPQASIYVHYVINNELRFEEKTINIEKDFENSIKLSAPLEAKPSEEVSIRVETDPESYVGLLGVDQSVLLLKSGNDLSRDEVFNSLNKFKTTTPYQHGYGRYPGDSSGLVTLTNADYPYNFATRSFDDEVDGFPIYLEEEVFEDDVAASGGELGTSNVYTETAQNVQVIRKNFAEIWIWQSSNLSADSGEFTLKKNIPDTITSWVVTGFSLSPNKGLALTENPSKIRVFQPFFVSTNLPYSVKRGEVIAVPVIIFNYLDKNLEAEVTMDNSDKEFEFTEATNEIEEKSSDEVSRMKRIAVPSNSGKSVSFMIRPKKVGSLTLKITATSPLAGDTIHQKLKVEPEGITKFENRAVFINLQDEKEVSQELKVDIPTEAVPDSGFIEFSVVGDLLGPTIKNLDNLVRMPYGCGEQNMVNFEPNILVVKYLEVTNRKMPSVVEKAKKFLEIGYQRELTYKHDDGSYSAFGKSDPAGSTWLTAYVVRSFHQAAKYTTVDPNIINEGLNFLASKQKENGEFPEVGKLFDNANHNALGLTSFVLIAFFENEEVVSKYKENIDKALQYVAEEVDKTDDQYSLSIAAVALQLAKHPQAKKVLAKLQSLAKQEDGRTWWSKMNTTSTEVDRSFFSHPRSNDVEITSYVLMALLEEDSAEATLPIIKWLIAQRNSNGGFSSTQDTVIGLQALTKFASKTGSGTGTIDIDFKSSDDAGNDNKDTIQVNPENSLVLQSHVLPKTTTKIDFTAKGKGSAMVQLSYRYNVADKDKKPSFKVTPTVKDTPLQQLTLEICAEYLPQDSSDKTKDSNMAVMEIALPSGFVGDTDSFDKIESIDRVKRIETKNADSTVIVYFDSLTPGDVKCLPVEGIRAHSVAKQKPAAVSLYDYYETDRRATEYYQVKSSLCDICEGSDCGEGCKKENLYTVIGPGTIRSNYKYNVAVSVHKADVKSVIKVGITGPSYNETKQVEVQPKSTVNVEFDVPKLSNGDYNLTAAGIEGVIFENSTRLNYADNKPSVFIQTDKATYKPGDLVQYRVLALDANTRPAVIDKPIAIAINDGAQNRIKQLTDVKLTKGVYAGELQLSEQPMLGTWHIAVSIADDSSETKSFEVAKYMLPKFEVVVETAKDIAKQDGVLKATIRAKYTYGKPVKGKATVSISQNNNNFISDQIKTIDIDGMGYVELLLSEASAYLPPLKVFAEVTEDLTGIKQNASTLVTLHTQRFKLNTVDPNISYYPGKSFAYQVVVKKLDGSPVQDATKKVKLTFESVNRYFNFARTKPYEPHNKSHVFEAPLNEHGIATFNVTLPESSHRYLVVAASYEDATSGLGTISKFPSSVETNRELKIEVNTKMPKLGNSISFDVKSYELIPYFVYTIVARANIVKSEYVNIPENCKSHTIKFIPTFEMVPQASIFVHYVINNELRFEEITINIEMDFENSIKLSVPLEAQPSEEVCIRVETDPESYVGLLGVDQSVLLLKSGNDLSRDEVFNSLNKFKTTTPYQHGYGRYPGDSSGLVTLTNADYPYYFNNLEKMYPPIMVKDKIHLQPKEKLWIRGSIPAPIPQVRKEFPENWMFINNIADSGEFTLKKKIPDTITSWVVTGFSLSPNKGLALIENPSKIRVFQPLFVSTNLPYSVKHGEVIAVPVIIFNYLDKNLEAEVTMDNSDKEFEFTEATNEIEEKSSDEVSRMKRIAVPSNSGKSVSFMIRPKKVGSLTLKITATSPLAGDTIHQKLKVEPEGVTKFENIAVFINLQNEKEVSQELKVDIPTEAVPDSGFIEFSVVGDLLGPTIKNLDNLVRMPYGCGEQNMVNFVPNILVVKYLEVTNRKMPSVAEKAKKFLEIGYQRELTYKHDDGSYSAFGKSDPAGSTWLTAYVVRSFHQAAKYTTVDPNIINEGLNFLASKQKENGEFPEVGKLFDNANHNALGLTSFVLIAFFENEEVVSKYKENIDKALQYVAEEVDKTDDQYSLSIAAVALQLAKHPQAKKVLAKLQSLAKQEDGRTWWSKMNTTSTEVDRSFFSHPRSNDVEITSYVLMALLEEDSAEATLPIIKWLIAQRNSNGGFSSTQDTVIGLQALTKFASKTGSGTGAIDINFKSSDDAGNDNKDTIQVNPENSLVLQSHVLPKTTTKIDFTAKGKGSAMVQLSYRYNVADKDKKPSFKVTPTVKDTPLQQLTLEICAEYLPQDSSDKTKDSNMAVMEIALPSGFVGDTDSFDKIESIDRVKRIETNNADSTVIVYFDSLTPGDVKCLPVEGIRAHSVAKQKPAAVSLYDYYETDRRATEYYQVKSSLCDICEGSDCGEGCKKEK